MRNSIRKILIFNVLILLCSNIGAQTSQWLGDHLIFGVEWGYSSTFINQYHRNFLASEGNRVDEKGVDLIYKGNGILTAGVGVRFAEKYTFELRSGYIGIRHARHCVPVTGRFTYNFKGYESNGWLTYAEGGIISPHVGYATYTAQIGTGYRVALSRRMSADFTIAARMCGDQPSITDPETGTILPTWNVRTNFSNLGALTFCFGLNF